MREDLATDPIGDEMVRKCNFDLTLETVSVPAISAVKQDIGLVNVLMPMLPRRQRRTASQ